MPEPLVVEDVAAVRALVGRELGPSDWLEITQERIDAFATATGDDQWIHTDPARAQRESPWKTTIAHGYLTLALAPVLLRQVLDVRGFGTVVNTGMDKMRLSSAVPAGSRVRLWVRVHDVRDLPGGRVRATFALRFEVEGASKPACLARVAYVYIP